MRTPLSWLKQYVDIGVDPQSIAHELTMAGTEVGAIEQMGGWGEVFVGEVKEINIHPNADRLRLVSVNIGSDILTVVCGAPNVAEGQKIAFAKVGAVLNNPHSGGQETLKTAKIRGVESSGMVCSEEELGLGNDSSGILVLPNDAPIGTPLENYLGDTVFDLELTPNRPDCMSVIGVAREIAAITGKTIKDPDTNYTTENDPIEAHLEVNIEDPSLCSRYTASLIRDVVVGPSPTWITERLIKAGQRPINNVVDITNYVMLEYGQPLHAFDFRTINSGKIIIRQAAEQETFTTLDGTERKLTPPMLVIADSDRAVALAGIMGGLNTEMTNETTTVLLESATFNAVNTRKTSQSLRIRSESSSRFEKGLQPELALIALKRATYLIQKIAGGKVCSNIIDEYPVNEEDAPISLTLPRIKQVLGLNIKIGEVCSILESLGFSINKSSNNELMVKSPYWRSDIDQTDDLIEEIARMVGYDNLPISSISTPIPSQTPEYNRNMREKIRDLMVSSGMQEVISYSLVSLKDLEKSTPSTESLNPIRIANPMSEYQEYLRTNMLSSILNTLSYNLNQIRKGMKIFEIGRTYLQRKGQLPTEREVLVGALTGQRWSDDWLNDSTNMDIFDAKGIIEGLFRELRVEPIFEPSNNPLFAAGNAADIHYQGQYIGLVGSLNDDILSAFDIDIKPVSVFELDLDKICKLSNKSMHKYEPISRYPGSYKDLALTLDNSTPSSTVKRLIERHKLVHAATLFDLYEGDELDDGTRSLAYRILFQSEKGTLTGEEINKALNEILGTLKHQVGATLRS